MAAEHWGRRPRDWAELAEPSNHELFAQVLRRLRVAPGTRLLDVGCGSGYALRMAAERGAIVTGLDITAELLAIARERVPSATLVAAGMDSLPFPSGRFDVVVGFNAFQFADDPLVAVAEAARVARVHGLVAATTFAEPERNESTALHLALEPLRASASGRSGEVARHLPYALSSAGGLERLLSAAGLTVVERGEVPVVWAHASADEAVRAVLASGGGAMAIDAAGPEAARAALADAVRPFVAPDGRVTMHNVFRYAIGRRDDRQPQARPRPSGTPRAGGRAG
ncbi:MAG TPA: class I SAM-dependent methyltransferase [Solirubrobacteraceae bacterium]|nr:class I SAM-dependent methyltransferase [Solirubrobacteraceae bacterium]